VAAPAFSRTEDPDARAPAPEAMAAPGLPVMLMFVPDDRRSVI
jgi:hypothetical protein